MFRLSIHLVLLQKCLYEVLRLFKLLRVFFVSFYSDSGRDTCIWFYRAVSVECTPKPCINTVDEIFWLFQIKRPEIRTSAHLSTFMSLPLSSPIFASTVVVFSSPPIFHCESIRVYIASCVFDWLYHNFDREKVPTQVQYHMSSCVTFLAVLLIWWQQLVLGIQPEWCVSIFLSVKQCFAMCVNMYVVS